MSLLYVGLLFVLSIGVHAEQCKYEFIVPEGNCRQNPTLNSEDEQIPESIMHMQSNLQTVQRVVQHRVRTLFSLCLEMLTK
jgi:hypothetical protein